MKYPLGRIHPHGSGGKSVYQRSGSGHSNGAVDTVIRWCLAGPAIAIGILWLFTASPETWVVSLGFFSMAYQFLKG